MLAVKLADLGLEVHPKKRVIKRTSERVDVLGYKISKNRRWLRNDNGYRFQRNYKRLKKQLDLDFTNLERIKPRIAGWIGHAKHAKTQGLRQKIFEHS